MKHALENNTLELRINQLIELLGQLGLDLGSISGIEVSQSTICSEGRCLKSKKHFDRDSIVIQLPARFLINYRFALNDDKIDSFLKWCSTSYSQRLTRYDALLLLLVSSRFGDESTFMYKFTQTLPSNFDTPEYFDPQLIDILPTHVKKEVKSRQQDLHSKFEFMSAKLKEFSVSNELPFPVDKLTWDVFKWAFCSMNSRVFYIEETNICSQEEINKANQYFGDLAEMERELNIKEIKSMQDYREKCKKDYDHQNNFSCMAPILDFANHSAQSNAKGHFDETNNCYQFISTEKLGPGDQVLVKYGYHNNQTLLIEYGFVMDNNDCDKIVFPLDDFEPILDTISDPDRKQTVIDIAISQNLFKDMSCDRFSGPSWSLLRFLDVIVRLKKSAAVSPEELEYAEIDNYDDIRVLLTEILQKYEKNLKNSRSDLNEFVKRANPQNHVGMVLKLVESQIDIIDFNLECITDDHRWINLF